ncbi:uncharacterized protein EI90DRAFT_3121459 [Cantharellus anzutake]|uniref:uncharacterized protein n=1 Tax=Cantharellus anzutake TaxID=1750568 RepID=UPI0019083D8F|nr:uncharacterized protein EI90DRAFT_3121459 [Cantharellus anzutake]KAF8334113.1 hypothetical protein EI90DRAFT_3121459 [Cantharellus anzutake]
MSVPNFAVSELFSVKGQVAVVTGGATGLGYAMAAALVQNGCKVYISSRKESQLREAAEKLNKLGPGTCYYFATNLLTKAGCEALGDHIKSRESNVHILINNSGATWAGPWDNFPEKGWDNIMALNVKAIFYVTASLTPALIKDKTALAPGRVINISSVASYETQVEDSVLAPKGVGFYSYAVSKAAVNHLTKLQAVKLAPHHVTANAILPGMFPTKMTDYSFSQNSDALTQSQPTGRAGIPQDIAGTLLYLVSPASAHTTGALVPLDGGKQVSGIVFSARENVPTKL